MNTRKIIQNCIFAIALSIALIACSDVEQKASDLKVSEGLKNPIGFYDESPGFSWKLPIGVAHQTAYSIVVASSPDLLPNKADLWKSGKVDADQTLFVDYEGKQIAPIPGGPLTSAEATYNCPYGKVRSAWKLKNGNFT